MAKEIGTANDLEDLFGKIVAFLTSSPNLVAAGQAWQVLRQERDNLAAVTTDLVDTATAANRRIIHTCRYDSRSLNIDDITTSLRGEFLSASVVMGSSYVRMQLKIAREIKTVRLQGPNSGAQLNYALRNFRLQYSDNGSTWTTALTVNASAAVARGEWRDYAVPGAPGAHLYWRIVIDSAQTGTTTISWGAMLLLDASGAVANHFGSEVILKATGLAGTEEIFVGLRSEYSAADGWYNLFLNGYTGFDPNERSWFNQPGALPGLSAAYPLPVPMVPCWNAAMSYWLVASGRSFRFAVKVSTSYEGGYLGFILPYASPDQYPYPLAVGGSLVPQTLARSAEWRYSYANFRHGVFPGPGGEAIPNTEGRGATLYLRSSSGEWRFFANRPGAGGTADTIYGPDQNTVAPYLPINGWRSVWPHCMNDQWTTGKLPYRECLGGGYMPQPCVLLQRSPNPMVFGELEGTFVISGYNNAAENTTFVSGVPAVVFQNAYRNSVHELWALTMNEA